MANRIILVTGTRHDLPIEAATKVKDTLQDDVINFVLDTEHKECLFIHGGCPTGVDALVQKLFMPCWPFPAKWDEQGKSAGPVRNQAMVDACVLFRNYGHEVICYAFTAPDSRGTVDCMYRADKAKLEVVEVQLEVAIPRSF